MNRSVMNRQMFAKGGAAFPDLSGDGQVTQRDILMGRGVQFKEQGGPAMPMTREELYGVPQETRQQQLRLRENIMDRGMIPEGLRNIGRAFGLDIESPEGYQRAKEVEYQLMRERELMRQEQPDVRMQEGGMVPPMDPAMMAPPMDPAMMAPPMDPAMQEGIGSQLDPAIVEPLLAEAATRFGSIDEASDYEDLINRVRGDAAPLEARRDELSMFVRDADAAQTPDSVLAMVQPVIQMSGVDQGIGGLAQQAMDVPVEGPMAEGIMSMAAAPEPMPAEMPMGMDQGMGGPAPVNFNQGGAVRRGDDEPVQYYQEAGVVMTPEQEASLAQAYGAGAIEGAQQGYDFGISQIPEVQSIEDLFGPRQEQYRNLLGGSEEQKNLTQAQMLFDIANLGLGFAGGAGAVRPGMSPAEQLAASAVKLQTLPTISQRAGAQLEQQQKVDFAAMQAAEAAQKGQMDTAAKAREALLKRQTELEKKRLELDKDKIKGQLEFKTFVTNNDILNPDGSLYAAAGKVITDSVFNLSKLMDANPNVARGLVPIDKDLVGTPDNYRLTEDYNGIKAGTIVSLSPYQRQFGAIPSQYLLLVDKNGKSTADKLWNLTYSDGRQIQVLEDSAEYQAAIKNPDIQVAKVGTADMTVSSDAYADRNTGEIVTIDTIGTGRFYQGRPISNKELTTNFVILGSGAEVLDQMARNKAVVKSEQELHEAYIQYYPELANLNEISTENPEVIVKDAKGEEVLGQNGKPIKLTKWLSPDTNLDQFRKYFKKQTGQDLDLREAIKFGTGVGNSITASASKFLQSFGLAENWGKDQIKAKHTLSMVTLMLRAGFAKNPRLAIAEWERIGTITPEVKMFSSPQAFFAELNGLKKELNRINVDLSEQIAAEIQGENDKTRLRTLRNAKYMLVQPMRMLASLDSNENNPDFQSTRRDQLKDMLLKGGT